MWPFVATQLCSHIHYVLDLGSCVRKDLSAGILVSTEKSSMHFFSFCCSNAITHIFKPRTVLRTPESMRGQVLSGILNVGDTWDLFDHKERSIDKRLARLEKIVVHNHPLT